MQLLTSGQCNGTQVQKDILQECERARPVTALGFLFTESCQAVIAMFSAIPCSGPVRLLLLRQVFQVLRAFWQFLRARTPIYSDLQGPAQRHMAQLLHGPVTAIPWASISRA